MISPDHTGSVQLGLDGLPYLHHTSVSGIQLFRMCKRRWNYKEVQGLSDPPGKAAKFGVAGHKRLEHYLKTGQDILTPLERLGVERGYVPTPGAGLLVEHRFKGELQISGIPLNGYIDLVNKRHLQDLSSTPNGFLTLRDWKFKGSLDWESSVADLVDPLKDSGIQMLGYAEWARVNAKLFPGMQTVRLSHVTFVRPPKPRDCAETHADLPIESVAALWQGVAPHVVGMRETAAEADPKNVEPTEGDSTCHAFRVECPYAKQCRSKAARFAAIFKKHRTDAELTAGQGAETMGMGDRFKKPGTPAAAQPIQTQAAPAVQAPPKAQVQASPAGGVVGQVTPISSAAPPKMPPIQIVDESTGPDLKIVRVADAAQGRRYIIGGKVHTFLCFTPLNGRSVGSFIPDGGGAPALMDPDNGVYEAPPNPAPVQILPPDAPKSNPALASRTPTVGVPIQTPSQVPASPIQTDQARPEEVAQAQAAPAKRGRKPGSKNAPKDAAAPVAPAPQAQATEGGEEFEGVHLYFGCAPIGIATQSLGAWADALEREILEHFQVSEQFIDIRSTGKHDDLGFGKWEGFMAKSAVSSPPPPGHYVVGYGDKRIEVAAQALAQTLPAGNVTVGR